MLTYMACGVPVVASPFGMNQQVIVQGAGAVGAANESEWAERLIKLLRLRSQIEYRGRVGRMTVLAYFVGVIAVRLAAVLRALARRSLGS